MFLNDKSKIPNKFQYQNFGRWNLNIVCILVLDA
jgi:hypothetical protein